MYTVHESMLHGLAIWVERGELYRAAHSVLIAAHPTLLTSRLLDILLRGSLLIHSMHAPIITRQQNRPRTQRRLRLECSRRQTVLHLENSAQPYTEPSFNRCRVFMIQQLMSNFQRSSTPREIDAFSPIRSTSRCVSLESLLSSVSPRRSPLHPLRACSLPSPPNLSLTYP